MTVARGMGVGFGMAHPVVRWVRLWLHPLVLRELAVLYAKWLTMIANYLWNRALGIPIDDDVDWELLHPAGPLRQVRRELEGWRASHPRPRSA